MLQYFIQFSLKRDITTRECIKERSTAGEFQNIPCLYRLKFAYFICIGERKAELASHVLQFVFLGNTGFRFPFAHWPTKEVDPSTLYIIFWKAVFWLLKAGFKVRYCCCDGGEANRSFIKLHFKDKDPFKE